MNKLLPFILLIACVFFTTCEEDRRRSNPFDPEADPDTWAPSNLQAQVINNSQIKLTWIQEVEQISGFRIERKTGNGTFSQIAEGGKDVLEYTETGLTVGNVYSYRVKAFTDANESNYAEITLNFWQDCNGEWDGTAVENECGCVGGNTGLEEGFCYGCTDPRAYNYGPDATINDGSCEYYLTVTSPNGCENWEPGSSHSITWSSSNLSGNVGIELLSNGSATFNGSITSSTTNVGGSFSWSIPSDRSEHDYYEIKIYSASNSDIYDKSDGYFSINNPDNDFITVTYPNGCEVWYKNITYTITWDDPTAYTGSMQISLYDGGTKISDIGSTGAVVSPSISWTIPSSIQTGDNYFIGVARTANTSIYDTNNQSFSIE